MSRSKLLVLMNNFCPSTFNKGIDLVSSVTCDNMNATAMMVDQLLGCGNHVAE
jgi:hypothetical protein